MLIEILIAFAAAAILGLMLWALFGLLLMPVFGKNMVTFCFVHGSGRELEQRVRAFGWLRESRKKGGRLVIVDCGLTEQGLSAVQHLRKTYLWLDYCPNEVMTDYIEVMHHRLEKGEDL